MHLFGNTSRSVLGMIVLAASTGCLADFAQRPQATQEPIFDPMLFFLGRTYGEGTLAARFSSTRTLQVEGMGRSEADGSFRLDQTITYSDSTVESRVWHLRRVDARHYAATLSDAKGDATAESAGNLFHVRYLLRQPAVYVEQWLYLQPDGRSVTNQTQVTVLGVPWARLSEKITREGPGR